MYLIAVSFKIIMTGSTRGAGIDHHTGAPPVFSGVSVSQSLILRI